MSHNAFDPHGEPPRRFPSSGDPSGWRAFDSGAQAAAAASPSPPRSRPRNPYGTSDSGGQWTGKLMDAPPTVEAPSLWPPVSEPSAPRVGAGLRPYNEPTTQEAPALRPGTRFREPATSENLTVGQRPPSPYREYATGENPAIAPPARRPDPAASDNYRVPSSRRPATDDHRRPPQGRPERDDPAPPFGRPPAVFGPPQRITDTVAIDRQHSPYRDPPTGENQYYDRQPPHEQQRFGPAPHAADTATIDRQHSPYRDPPTGESQYYDRQPPFHQSPPRFGPPHAADTATMDRQQSFHPSPLADTATIDRQSPPFRDPATAESAAVRPDSAPPFGYGSSQRSIQVEPDTGSMTDVQLAHSPADPPWQSRRAAEEDASFISPIRVLGTVGVIVIIIAIAGAVIFSLNMYGDKF